MSDDEGSTKDNIIKFPNELGTRTVPVSSITHFTHVENRKAVLQCMETVMEKMEKINPVLKEQLLTQMGINDEQLTLQTLLDANKDIYREVADTSEEWRAKTEDTKTTMKKISGITGQIASKMGMTAKFADTFSGKTIAMVQAMAVGRPDKNWESYKRHLSP